MSEKLGSGGYEAAMAIAFLEFSKNPDTLLVLEEASLEYLKTTQKEFFDKEFNGELNSEGYLLRIDGSSSGVTPSMLIEDGHAMSVVMDMAKQKLSQ